MLLYVRCELSWLLIYLGYSMDSYGVQACSCARSVNGCRYAQEKDPKRFENDYLSFSSSRVGIGMSHRNG